MFPVEGRIRPVVVPSTDGLPPEEELPEFVVVVVVLVVVVVGGVVPPEGGEPGGMDPPGGGGGVVDWQQAITIWLPFKLKLAIIVSSIILPVFIQTDPLLFDAVFPPVLAL